MKMKKRILILTLICTIALSGCGVGSTENSTAELEQQISDLKEENESLKAELESLKASEETEEAVMDDTDSATNISEEEQYIKDYITLDSVTVTMCEGYSGSEPGIRDISIKNNGDRNVNQLVVTVYFQDANGNDNAEDSFMVIGGYFGGGPLKANYSWKMESDEYYAIENLSDEVDITRNRVEISQITFGE